MSEVSSQTLHIVARELAAELNEARAALEAFGEQQENVDLLRKCAERLHSVHGALRVAEVYGAALLAEEMEQGTRYLIENFEEKRHLAEGLDALMRAMVQLPTYLERVMSGGRDMALVLLPLLNDLRAVRGHALLSEGTLLLLNLTSDQQASPSPTVPGETALTVAQWARKLRTRFQLGLLGWIKGDRVEQNLEILSRAAEKLEQVATTQPVFQLYWVVGAVLEGLREGGVEGSASIKRLLGQADREMRRLYESGEARYAENPPVDLLNNLLYYVARTRSNGPRVSAVRASFRLNELLPVDEQVEQARESLAAPSVKLMKTVAAAIKEDLSKVKDALDIFVRKGASEPEELNSQLELLRKIGDTLGVLGLGDLREKVQVEANDLQGIIAQRTAPSEGTLLRMAATLIRIEDSLDEQLIGLIVPTHDEPRGDSAPKGEDDVEFRHVTEAVLRECIVNMARIKESIALSVEKPRESQTIEQIPALIRGITAGLLMLGKTRAVEITEGISQALHKYVRPNGAIVQEAVDRLADAIVAVEYYMETLQAGRSDPWYMLDNAETCLRFLNEIDPVPVPSPSMADQDPIRTMVIEPMAAQQAASTQHERTAVLTAALEPHMVPQGAKAPPPASAQAAAVVRPDVDPEFIELFIEEAKDEIAKLQEFFPRWDENPQDTDALTHVRRSFHTLKGSGRMVGAQLIGDFAWSIENLLNRVINKTLDRTPDMMTVLRIAVGAVPQLVEQLETNRAPETDVLKLIAKANEIAGVKETPAVPTNTPVAHAAPAAAPVQKPVPQAIPAAHAKPAPAAHDPSPPTLTEHVPPLMATGKYPRSTPSTESTSTATVTARQSSLTSLDQTSNTALVKKLEDELAAELGLGDTRRSVAPVQADVATLDVPVEEAIELSSELPSDDDVFADASPTSMDPVLHEIFAKETAGHLAEVRRFIASCEQLAPPYPVTEALHRACHTLSGTAKTAGARQGIKVAEPLNSYVRKLFDYGFPMPPAGLAALKDAVAAIEDVIRHIDEHTGYFSTHPGLSARLASLDQALDTKIAQLSPEPDAANSENSASLPVLAEMPEDREEVILQSEDAYVPSDEKTITMATLTHAAPAFDPNLEITQAVAAPPDLEALERGDDVVELPATDAKELDTFTLRALRAQMGVLDPSTSMEEALDDSTRSQPTLSHPALELTNDTAEPVAEEVIELSGEIQDDDAPTDVGNHIEVSETLTADADLALTSDSVIERMSESQLIAEPELSNDQDVVLSSDVAIPAAAPVAAAAAPAVARVEEAEEEGESEDFDADVAAIFTEEATELLETADSSLSAWMRDRANNALVFELKRALHTLKGGARMAGLRAMGDLSHELESFMQNVESGLVPAEPRVFEALQASLDELHKMRDAVSSGQRCRPAKQLIARIRALGRGEEPPPEVAAPTPVVTVAPVVEQVAPVVVAPTVQPVAAAPVEEPVQPAPAKIEDTGEIEVEFSPEELDTEQSAPAAVDLKSEPEETTGEAEAPVALPPGREQPQQQERQEFARVDADLLDNLLNNAGEVSIFRSRLEQQVSSIEFNLAELGRTVTRLKEQLRKLELETEAQILHKHQDDSTHRAEFDPLELDRYSSIQQLSRALAESVSDVGSIEGLLQHLTREAQNLLLQQSRVVTELQGGLMRTRMVPFQRHVQRLTRLVRQVATDTNKRCELVVEGASGELDRQVLERMLPPFEHMLRNSVVHGIETPEERAAKGKPESGTITVGLHREGSEMVIVLQDDGRGIDVKAVRERAVQRGILQPGKVLTDEEALQLVLEPGFSTASSVTQHAGRGVGMDVVVNEIKKLGGVLFTESKPGQGVKFTIRLPFTLAIAQSLLVRVGEELYALPLSSVEGVARVSRDEVEQHLGEEQPSFNYGGQVYRFQHLGTFIGAGPSVLPDAADVSVPVVLIRAGEHSTALVMDELVGSREMVVKSVGPQIATIRGIAGATILGDGRIVIILDMGALVRSEWRARGPMESQPAQDKRTFALVVDDSITVRRVTQRFLERNGMRVMTAKDGVDAWSILQDHLPDIILLDIEMPRMDGYELAAQVRSDARLGDIPIVMITSRVGEKHRARAIELGVNDYLGKPYQENQLLDAIEPLVEARRKQTEQKMARSV